MGKRALLLTIALIIINPVIPAGAYDQANSMVKIKGAYGMSVGITTEDFWWKQANADYQEKNWRYLFGQDRINTYDPRVFDRYQLEIETDTGTPWNAYTEIMLDPWSFVGVGKETVFATDNDFVNVKYKYWEATGKTINESYRTYFGDSIGYPELKVIKNKVTEHIGTPALWPARVFDFSRNRSVEIDYLFRGVRKLWVEYNEEPVYFKAFAMADQAEALTSDDPMKLSNNHVYWAPSPWLFYFDPGINLLIAQEQARWKWDLTWYAEDSNRHYLTFLRGFTVGYKKPDAVDINITVASPMNLWDYYEDVTSIPMAGRIKFYPAEGLEVGAVATVKYGIHKKKIKGRNEVIGFDLSYDLWDKTTLFGEIAGSRTHISEPNRDNRKGWGEDLRKWGEAGKAGVKSEAAFAGNNTLDWDFSFAAMTEEFDPGLADYKDTRVDRDWGRHIWFDPLSDEDKAIRIGDSIDINRYVFGANARANLLNNLLDFRFNFRNARTWDDNKFVENILRAEATFNPFKNIQLKGLALYRAYPNTTGNFDSFLRDRYTDGFLRNFNIEDGDNADLMTFSGGAKVDLLDGKISVYGIYEATNDPQDFPRSALSNVAYNTLLAANSTLAGDHGITVNRLITQAYNQNLFDLPPYDFYNIWKGVIAVRPLDNVMLKYTHVTNGNRNYAALFDNNHNHDAFEIAYTPVKNVSLRGGYSISRIINLRRAIDTAGADRQFTAHHNLYARLNWNLNESQKLTLQYGEAWIQDDDLTGVFGTRWPSTRTSVLDTRHIFRAFFQGEF